MENPRYINFKCDGDFFIVFDKYVTRLLLIPV
jgi:hypothetical protein